jgi:hypothetical protein
MRVLRQVDVDGAGQRVGHDQRRAGEVVGADERMDAALEVAVAGKDRATARSPSLICLLTSSGSGPLLPMQVVQP